MDAGTVTYCFKDSCAHLNFSLSLEVPAGTDSVSMQICDSLVAEFVRSVRRPGCYDDEDPGIAPCDYHREDIQALVDHYGHAAHDRLLQMAMDDYKSRLAYLDESPDLTDEDRERIKNDIPQWAFEFAITRTISTAAFVVYNAQAYCYYGGAHGGVIGSGDMTFDMGTGHKIGCFIPEDATDRLQPLLRQGLLRYYSECGDTITDAELSDRLQILGTVIPLPERTPCPNAAADSLIFTYGQYEIACYADGMPSFTLSVQDLLPCLTPEARTLLGAGEVIPTKKH